jgi:hypothetical protein
LLALFAHRILLLYRTALFFKIPFVLFVLNVHLVYLFSGLAHISTIQFVKMGCHLANTGSISLTMYVSSAHPARACNTQNLDAHLLEMQMIEIVKHAQYVTAHNDRYPAAMLKVTQNVPHALNAQRENIQQ